MTSPLASAATSTAPPPVAGDVRRTPEGRVASPCINICKMHEPTALCRGCARTIPEIASWSKADDAERIRILALLPERRALLRAHGALETEPRP
ncbi:hypothetical protein CDN99_14925 [Roseateles aquatilis]|uniref:DUF1289 domain-containing protein n=1 Tax=Roseateles aquatilis TaxID=431061 RepID=A0A246J872_9BURK|nr:DUF1289 domain-containing protein [Roseateles aquatilis]OWQ88771.1 hypothetical protein CDN99_14925 [Roseateles aquatilis]